MCLATAVPQPPAGRLSSVYSVVSDYCQSAVLNIAHSMECTDHSMRTLPTLKDQMTQKYMYLPSD